MTDYIAKMRAKQGLSSIPEEDRKLLRAEAATKVVVDVTPPMEAKPEDPPVKSKSKLRREARKAHLQQMAEDAEKKRLKAEARKLEEEERIKKKKEMAEQPQLYGGRLPHDSSFELVYDANAEMWDGILAIDGKIFKVRKSGLFRACSALDKMYRQSLQEQAN